MMLDGIQSALNPQGPNAALAAEITWILVAGTAVIFLLVMALAAAAVLGKRRAWLGSHALIVAGGIVVPLAVLLALLFYTLVAASRAAPQGEPALRIELVGHQWWWQVRYLDPAGGLDFETANEIRIPAGTPVELRLRSADVLHSLWVPTLAGKLDLVPGKDNRLRLLADEPGVWRGQCAEYCGGPHAQMALYVVSHEKEEFENWKAAQRLPAREANELFLSHCAACHTVRGTAARGTLGPDLSHVGSRLSIGAGILPNNAGAIAGWIASSQHIKPKNLMPSFGEFSGEELRELARYVESLK